MDKYVEQIEKGIRRAKEVFNNTDISNIFSKENSKDIREFEVISIEDNKYIKVKELGTDIPFLIEVNDFKDVFKVMTKG